MANTRYSRDRSFKMGKGREGVQRHAGGREGGSTGGREGNSTRVREGVQEGGSTGRREYTREGLRGGSAGGREGDTGRHARGQVVIARVFAGAARGTTRLVPSGQ